MIRRSIQNRRSRHAPLDVRTPRWRDRLAELERRGGLFVHFSHFNKVGINPVNRFGTPTGFYAYPLTYRDISAFANDRPVAIVFSASRATALRLKSYTKSMMRVDIGKIVRWSSGAIDDTAIKKWMRDALVDTPGGMIWNITREASATVAGRKSPHAWTNLLRVVLGYDGVIDECMSIIHHHEPCQAVFFDTTKIDVVDVIDKGKSTDIEPRRSRVDLRGKDLRNTKDTASLAEDIRVSEDISGANLSGVDLRGVRFYGTIARGANFRGANLEGAEFSRADIRSANMWKANLSHASIHDSDPESVSFSQCVMVKFDARGEFKRANFHGANLTEASMRHSSFVDCDFDAAVMVKANLSNSSLLDCSMRGVSLRGSDMSAAVASNVDLRDAVMVNCYAASADFTGAYMARSDLRRATFTNASMRRADLSRANVTGADFRGAYLSETNMAGVYGKMKL